MKPHFAQDFAREITEALRAASSSVKHELLAMSDDDAACWWARNDTTLPAELLKGTMGTQLYDDQEAHTHNTALITGAHYIRDGEDYGGEDTVMVEMIVPDQIPDSRPPVEKCAWVQYFPTEKHAEEQLYAAFDHKDDTYEENTPVTQILTDFDSLDWESKAIVFRQIMTTKWEHKPMDFEYPPTIRTKKKTKIGTTKTPAVPKLNDEIILEDDEDELERELPDPVQVGVFRKFSFYTPVDNFVDVLLKFSKATDLINGTINTRFSKAISKTFVKQHKGLSKMYDRCEVAGLSALPLLRIRSESNN